MPTCGIAHIDDGRVQTMLLENTRIARDEQHAAAFIQAAVSKDRFVRRRGGEERNRNKQS